MKLCVFALYAEWKPMQSLKPSKNTVHIAKYADYSTLNVNVLAKSKRKSVMI